jgi:hypothetical protein
MKPGLTLAAGLERRLEDLEVTLVGAGRSGSFIALVLAMLGVHVRVYDPDVLGPENQGRQLYRKCDITAARPKAEALRRVVRSMVPWARITGHATAFTGRADQVRSAIVVIAVDTMHERRRIWEVLREAPNMLLLVDVRLGPGQVRLHEVRFDAPGDADDYETSLHGDPIGEQLACRDESSAHAAAAAAALVGGAISGWHAGEARSRWIAVDLDRPQWAAAPPRI